MTTIAAATRWFPLIARPRPPCTPLTTRIADLCALAESAASDEVAASTVLNQAALLASDVGFPDLARERCHRHALAYLRALPLDGARARRALEPLVNLARLHVRAGDGKAAFQLLTNLYSAVDTHADIIIDGLPVSISNLTSSPAHHRQLRQWLWTVLLADGTRALTSAGQWNDALAHLKHHKGIGRRMFDGRQVAVVAYARAGDPDQALQILKDTAPGEPWENTITALLMMLCGEGADKDLSKLLSCYQDLPASPDLTVFHTRLGLAIIDAADYLKVSAVRPITTGLLDRFTRSPDGHAARDIVTHDCVTGLTTRQKNDLIETVNATLNKNVIPQSLRNRLSAALTATESALTNRLLSAQTPITS